MKIYPEFLEPAVRDDLLANHSFYESGQFAYLLESFAEHYLRQRPVDLLEATLDPGFVRELAASGVDPAMIAGRVSARLAARAGRKLTLYVLERTGPGLGMEEIGLGPGDWRNLQGGAPIEGDLVLHFLDNDRIVYSRPFEGEIGFAAGKSVRSRFLGRTLLQRFGELFVIYQETAPAEALQPLNEMDLRISTGSDQRLMLELDPAGRRESLRLGERTALCQVGGDHKLGLIVTPRGQEPEPPKLDSMWVGVGGEGMIEMQAVVREAFELRGGKIQAQISPRQSESEPSSIVLEHQGRDAEGRQVFRGRVEPPELLESGETVDVRLNATNRAGFRLEGTGGPMTAVRIRPLIEPQPLDPPAYLSPASMSRGFNLVIALPGGEAGGKRFLLHCRRDRDLFQLGPVLCNGERLVFWVPPIEGDEDDGPLEFWITCDDAGVPLATHMNGPDCPLLKLPIYPIAPGGRPVTGVDNFLFSDEALHFGPERLRLIRWAPPRAIPYPATDQYPYFLWRTRERPPMRFYVKDGSLATEGGQRLARLCIGTGTNQGMEGASRGEVLVPTHASGRKAYLYIQPGDQGGLELRKAAGRIHDVALDFEPLGASAALRTGSCLLAAGTALFGIRLDHETLDLSLLGHWLMEDELRLGVLVSSGQPEGMTPTPWIHVAADRALEMTLTRE